jgi:hypothetical protein
LDCCQRVFNDHQTAKATANRDPIKSICPRYHDSQDGITATNRPNGTRQSSKARSQAVQLNHPGSIDRPVRIRFTIRSQLIRRASNDRLDSTCFIDYHSISLQGRTRCDHESEWPNFGWHCWFSLLLLKTDIS